VVASVFAPPQLDPAVAGVHAFYPGLASAFGEMRERLQEVARSGAALLREEGVDAESVFTMGRPVHELVGIAQTHHADLVVLGSRSRAPLARVLGSTADALLDRVQASVLVARTSPPPARILAATDGSPASGRAVAWALDHARATGASLTVQHVLEYPEGARPPAEAMLRDAVGWMHLSSSPRVAYHLDAGRPSERILGTAEALDADLVVLGSRGLGRIRGWLLGSVSRRVTNVAPASVLVVKQAPDEA
jgi:nucleotide-binding universal stress UspA family protein